MTNNRQLGVKERSLLGLSSNCKLLIDVFALYQKWNVTQRQLTQICGCSVASVERWLNSQRQPPEPI